MYKAVDIQRQEAAGLKQVAFGPVQAQSHGRTCPCRYAECCLTLGGTAQLIAVVDHAVGGQFGFVDRDADIGGADFEVVAQADKANAACRGLQGGPFVGGGSGLREHRQRKVDVAQAQAYGSVFEGAHLVSKAAADASKGIQASSANGQRIDRDRCG